MDLKSRLASRPILNPPDYTKPICMTADASNFCVGACLFSRLENATCFLGRKLRTHELHYSTVEKEALALVTAVRAIPIYFRSAAVVVYADPLQFMNNMANYNQKLLRCSLELPPFSLDIRHRPGKLNVYLIC